MAGNLDVAVRGALNPLVATRIMAFDGAIPDDVNVARELRVGSEALSREEAYALTDGEPLLTEDALRGLLQANIVDGAVGGVPVAELSAPERRVAAFEALEAAAEDGPVVVVAEVAQSADGSTADVTLADVEALHVDADGSGNLAWYAPQELETVLGLLG